jgi:hypothetical protein
MYPFQFKTVALSPEQKQEQSLAKQVYAQDTGVFRRVRKDFVALTGDIGAAMTLDYILYLFTLDIKKAPWLAYNRNNKRWMVMPRAAWAEALYVTAPVFDRFKACLEGKGLIELDAFKLYGNKNQAVRPVLSKIQEELLRLSSGTEEEQDADNEGISVIVEQETASYNDDSDCIVKSAAISANDEMIPVRRLNETSMRLDRGSSYLIKDNNIDVCELFDLEISPSGQQEDQATSQASPETSPEPEDITGQTESPEAAAPLEAQETFDLSITSSFALKGDVKGFVRSLVPMVKALTQSNLKDKEIERTLLFVIRENQYVMQQRFQLASAVKDVEKTLRTYIRKRYSMGTEEQNKHRWKYDYRYSLICYKLEVEYYRPSGKDHKKNREYEALFMQCCNRLFNAGNNELSYIVEYIDWLKQKYERVHMGTFMSEARVESFISGQMPNKTDLFLNS